MNALNRKEALKRTLVAALFFLSLGGFLLHLRIHSPGQIPAYFVPFISGIFSLIVLPLLFWFRRTVAYAYVINGFIVIIGTITMTHFSIANFPGPLSLAGIFLDTTLADIAVLWGKFALGKAIFDLHLLRSDADVRPPGRYFRYPNMGWWWVHLVTVTVVYALGNILWK